MTHFEGIEHRSITFFSESNTQILRHENLLSENTITLQLLTTDMFLCVHTCTVSACQQSKNINYYSL